MSTDNNEKSLTYDEVREMVHVAVRRDGWYERFRRFLTDDEFFVKDILEGASEEEIERYFAEFPEYARYRDRIRKKISQ